MQQMLADAKRHSKEAPECKDYIMESIVVRVEQKFNPTPS
jgi:hypothetical protein